MTKEARRRQRAAVDRLLARVSSEEERLRSTLVLAPSLAGAQLRVRVGTLVHTLRPLPASFEGWGLFEVLDERRARLVEEALRTDVARYLQLFPLLRVRLVAAMQGRTWLAYPANESDSQQRGWRPAPLVVHLVERGAAFEQVQARCDGAAWWFEDLDRRADPRPAERLRQALADLTPAAALRLKDLTPEARAAYELATQRVPGFEAALDARRGERRIREALALGGGRLHDVRDRGDYWWIEWSTADGVRHTSAITKKDLTVVSAGICLAGRDRDFDLASLVGVVKRADDDW